MRFGPGRGLAAALALGSAMALGLEGSPVDAAPGPLGLPGPAPSGRPPGFDAGVENARCEGCHQAIAAEWRASAHHDASRDPSYRRQLAREPLPFCRACHAPESDPARETTPAADDLGIGCVTCHVPGHTVLAAERPAPADGSTAAAPHPIERRADFGGVPACASCHEFPFPDQHRRSSSLAMQSTVSEHLQSPHASTPCAGCHMPRTPGPRAHRDHRFSASTDPALLASAVVLRAERIDATRVKIRLEPGLIGHAFPTGDMFRRLAVSAEALGPDWTVRESREVHLARHFARGVGNDGRPIKVLAGDDRVGPRVGDAREVVLDLGEAARDTPIAWRVSYQRVEELDERADARTRVLGEVVLDQGTLPVPATSPRPPENPR